MIIASIFSVAIMRYTHRLIKLWLMSIATNTATSDIIRLLIEVPVCPCIECNMA